jgi:hypothetical protein
MLAGVKLRENASLDVDERRQGSVRVPMTEDFRSIGKADPTKLVPRRLALECSEVSCTFGPTHLRTAT